MVFSSLFFIFFFLTLVMGVYIFLPGLRARNILLLSASLIFYAWGGPRYVLLLCGMVLICYFGALMIEGERRDTRLRRVYLVCTVASCLVLLGVFKYTDFLVGSFESIFRLDPVLPGIILPIGISFYTFQLISYVVDVYRGETQAQTSYAKLLLYAALFHQCIAGPIVRYADVCREIDHRTVSRRDVWEGLCRFTVGLGKKALLANACASVADKLIPADGKGLEAASVLSVLLGLVAYGMQVYLDFSAYSDMAIGMGRMVGFHFKENFNYPYVALSVSDFWRRWHMSLSSFFRDYVYIPLGGSRCSVGRQIFNLFAVWALTGLWHGASWTYVLWGLYFCLFLILEKFVFRWKKETPLPWWRRALRRLYTLAVVTGSWILFRFESLPAAGRAFIALFGAGGSFADVTFRTTLMGSLIILLISVAACTPILPTLTARLSALRRGEGSLSRFVGYAVDGVSAAAPALLLLLSTLALVGNSYNPFLYFNF